jgi:hypothetical protein
MDEQQGTQTGIVNLIESHPAFAIGVLVVIGALIFGQFQKGQATAAANGASSGLATDANGNKIVYVPTQEQFITINKNSNNNTNTGNTTTTNNPPVIISPAPVPPPSHTPKPPVQPPSHHPPVQHPPKYGLVWGARHTVTSDDTNHGAGALAYIASQSTMIMRTQQHAPSSVSISAGDIVKHNPGLRTNSILKIGQSIVLPSYERMP